MGERHAPLVRDSIVRRDAEISEPFILEDDHSAFPVCSMMDSLKENQRRTGAGPSGKGEDRTRVSKWNTNRKRIHVQLWSSSSHGKHPTEPWGYERRSKQCVDGTTGGR